jgi:hypothetical protein
MSDKQNHGLDKDNSSPASDEQSRDQNESPAKSYYYDDATGYEIYKEETDDADEEESS